MSGIMIVNSKNENGGEFYAMNNNKMNVRISEEDKEYQKVRND
jgi:hypothetical protein